MNCTGKLDVAFVFVAVNVAKLQEPELSLSKLFLSLRHYCIGGNAWPVLSILSKLMLYGCCRCVLQYKVGSTVLAIYGVHGVVVEFLSSLPVVRFHI